MGLVAYMMIDEYMMTFYHFAWLPILYITGLDKRRRKNYISMFFYIEYYYIIKFSIIGIL